MLKVGITGGIGTGKSFVCNIFKWLGIPVYDADLRAKQLVDESPLLKEQIAEVFGNKAFDGQGRYNRQYISSSIFENPELKESLERIIHPAVFKDNLQWFEDKSHKKYPYALKEAALLFESGSYKDLDKIIVVDTPIDLRIKRIKVRDNLDENEIKARMKNQWEQELKVNKADYVINNDGVTLLVHRVWNVHHCLLNDSSLSLSTKSIR